MAQHLETRKKVVVILDEILSEGGLVDRLNAILAEEAGKQ